MKVFKNIASTCIKCAKCIPDCSSYQFYRDEVHSPRGFLELISQYEKGSLRLDSNLQEVMDTCLLCNHCVSNCPISIPIDSLIQEIRTKQKISLSKRIYFFLLRHSVLKKFVFKFFAFLPPCEIKHKDSALWNLRFSRSFFLDSHPKSIASSKQGGQKKVAIFAGCLINYNYPHIGKSLLKVLDSFGVDVLLPKQECCGAPTYFSGDIQTSIFLVKKNLLYFEEIIDLVDAILIPEATCASVMLKDWQKILSFDEKNQEWILLLKKIQDKMFIATEWIYKFCDFSGIRKSKKRVTYHDSCHACKVLQITKEPREIIKSGFELIEMSDSSSCCGFGGIEVQNNNFEFSRAIGVKKIRDIQQTNAQIVSAECNACKTQIDYLLKKDQSNVIFYHPIELLEQMLERKDIVQ
ncbi:glycerol-3-phosphate dehydrogenase [Helicobacter anseris]|uniref:Glycolate oxidase iron-sulfur subunit n=1 Tax=Helicobacter anseris TaxID=375926 RepID=A0A3D8J962_9HELI|nr:(Fe-S)-binding protein [Helicobacter anseris]RDU74033.1 glycerol-3-phosphate dehydrogenase [Helicobacter anseris]